jgi:hypothetical protein
MAVCIYKITFFFSRGVLRYFIQTWQNNSFWCLLRRLSRPQDVGHLCLRYCKFFISFYDHNCSAQERAPCCRVTEKSHFSTLNVGLAGTGNRTQATCLEGNVTRRSSIRYAFDFQCKCACPSSLKGQLLQDVKEKAAAVDRSCQLDRAMRSVLLFAPACLASVHRTRWCSCPVQVVVFGTRNKIIVCTTS